jgi:N-acetylglucosaminyldiphosphoundecaprenol N-acetyl-beta-D-mannosaminyltransferase
MISTAKKNADGSLIEQSTPAAECPVPQPSDVTVAPETRDILGVSIHPLTMSGAVARAEGAITEREPVLFGVVNAGKLVSMRRDDTLHDAVVGADVILADGMAVVWASRILGRALPCRVAGIDLMVELLKRADQRSWSVYFLGASQKVLTQVVSQIETDYPNVRIAGCRNGYFDAAEDAAVAEGIRSSGADILFVAMSSPKKEVFLGNWASTLNVPVCHGVGGAFDVMAGKVRRAPMIWQRFGLEWLYRVFQEPRRMWRRYLVTNTLFCGMVARERLFGSRRTSGSYG